MREVSGSRFSVFWGSGIAGKGDEGGCRQRIEGSMSRDGERMVV